MYYYINKIYKYRAHSLSHDSSTCSNEQDKKQGHITTKKKPPNPAKRTNMYKYNVVCFLFIVFTAVECDIHVW